MKTMTILFVLATAMLTMAFPVNSLSANATPLPLEEQMVGDVTYVTGGVGDTEAAAMKHLAKEYSLEVTFTQKQAGQPEEFLSDVRVKIQDAQQQIVLDITTDGPFLLANLPLGNYLVIAEYNGAIRQKKVSLKADKHRKIDFNWPIEVQPELKQQNDSLRPTVKALYKDNSMGFITQIVSK
jgi:hypothetical protein